MNKTPLLFYLIWATQILRFVMILAIIVMIGVSAGAIVQFDWVLVAQMTLRSFILAGLIFVLEFVEDKLVDML